VKIHLLTAAHFIVPGVITKAFADLADAEAEAVELTNIMLDDDGQAQDADVTNWREHVRRLQSERNPADCYVCIDEHVVAGAVPDPVAHVLRRAESFIAGFEDDETQDGIPALLASIRGALAGAPRDELAAIRAAAKAHDDKMCDRANDGKDAWPPDGDDYNELFSIVMHGAMPDPVRDAAPDALAALKEAQAWLIGVIDSGDILDEDRACLERIDAAIAKAEGR
jgi:hypothetical protein